MYLTTAHYEVPATRADRFNGLTQLPGTRHDDPQRKTRRPSLRPPAVRRAPSPLLSINIYYYRITLYFYIGRVYTNAAPAPSRLTRIVSST